MSVEGESLSPVARHHSSSISSHPSEEEESEEDDDEEDPECDWEPDSYYRVEGNGGPGAREDQATQTEDEEEGDTPKRVIITSTGEQ